VFCTVYLMDPFSGTDTSQCICLSRPINVTLLEKVVCLNGADDAVLSFTSISTVLFPSSLLWPTSTGPKALSLAVYQVVINSKMSINPLKPELNPICYLLALLAHHFLHVSRIRVK